MTRLGRALIAIFLANAVAVVLVWWTALGPGAFEDAAGRINAVARLTGLVGTYLIVVQLLLRTHVPGLAAAVGKDPLKKAHEWNAYAAVGLIGVHSVLQLVGYALARRQDVVAELIELSLHYEGVLLATFAFLLLAGLTVVSLERVRHRIAWPLWRSLHLFTYAAVALSVPHQLATGSDFVEAPISSAYWAALLLSGAAAAIVVAVPRVLRAAAALRTTALLPPRRAVLALSALTLAVYLVGVARLAPEPVPVAAAPAPPTARPSSSPAPAVATEPPASAAPAPSAMPGVVTGFMGDVIDTPYGELQVRAVIDGGRLVDVELVLKPSATKRSHYMADAADPWLRKRAIAAQSGSFEVLSGATYTSLAYMRSLDGALRAAGMGGS